MADDRKRRDEQYGESERDESRNRAGMGDDVRSIADEEEEFEDREDLEDEEDTDNPY